jgi:methionyl-tRNA synthetase
VHGYVTVDGRKIGKSAGNAVSPTDAANRFGPDTLRYYLLRHVGSQRDGDFSWSHLSRAYEHELANDLGNLVSRTVALGRRYGPPTPCKSALASALADLVAGNIDNFELDRALDAVWRVIADTNAYINRTEPWKLAKQGRSEAAVEAISEAYAALRAVGQVLSPFLPHASARLLDALRSSSQVRLFPK